MSSSFAELRSEVASDLTAAESRIRAEVAAHEVRDHQMESRIVARIAELDRRLWMLALGASALGGATGSAAGVLTNYLIGG